MKNSNNSNKYYPRLRVWWDAASGTVLLRKAPGAVKAVSSCTRRAVRLVLNSREGELIESQQVAMSSSHRCFTGKVLVLTHRNYRDGDGPDGFGTFCLPELRAVINAWVAYRCGTQPKPKSWHYFVPTDAWNAVRDITREVSWVKNL